MEHQQQLPNALGQFAGTVTRFAQSLTTRRYTLPDKSVASQVLMYRQLLHTKCRPGLKLSRDYQETPAQKAVLHMPWWEEGIETTRKMVVSYDNLITRLWLNGAIMPHAPTDIVDKASIDTLLDEKGLPPVPHEYWVDRLGFQQPDPVTDFRSGGVLSLTMLVHIVEACPEIHERFGPNGDSVCLPFGITCINVTDMLAKICMLAKKVDRMDALLSQKPFWRMFADPYSILALQEVALDMLADVVVELGEERQIPGYTAHDDNNSNAACLPQDADRPGKVTVFDFSIILDRTEQRVEKDLLGSGPKSVEELKVIKSKLKQRYRAQLERKKQKSEQQLEKEGQQQQLAATAAKVDELVDDNANEDEAKNIGVAGQVFTKATTVATGAGTMAAGVFAKMKSPGFNPLRKTEDVGANDTTGTSQAPDSPDLMKFSASGDDGDDGDWIQSPAIPPTDAIEHFSIDDDDDML